MSTFAEDCGYQPTSRKRRFVNAFMWAVLWNVCSIALLPLTMPIKQALVG